MQAFFCVFVKPDTVPLFHYHAMYNIFPHTPCSKKCHPLSPSSYVVLYISHGCILYAPHVMA